MTYLAERLSEAQRYLDHLEKRRAGIGGPTDLERDLALRNDVLFSLLMIAQLVIDICGELSTRANLRFGDYTEAVMNLGKLEGFPPEIVHALRPLPGFRNIVVHEYVGLDYERVMAAADGLQPVRDFIKIVARMEQSGQE